jgi:hypothetical protein
VGEAERVWAVRDLPDYCRDIGAVFCGAAGRMIDAIHHRGHGEHRGKTGKLKSSKLKVQS